MTKLALNSDFEDRRVLITGGLGFIGSALAQRLVEARAQVTLVDSLIPEYGGNLFNVEGFKDRVHVNVSDVRDQHSLKALVEGVDYLFNLAGQTSHLDSMHNPITDLEINCSAQLSILEICREVNPTLKIVFASTRQIYGRPAYLPVDERHPLSPVDVNGINKMAGEMYHLLYNEIYGLRSTVLRLTNTYGPRMRIKDARQTFLGVWIRKVIEGDPIEVWGGSQVRDFTYIDDAVEALLLAATNTQADGCVFNLGGTEVVRLEDLAHLLTEIAEGGYEIRDFPVERKVIDIGDYYASFDLIADTLGWRPTVDLRSGLTKTVDYFRQNLKHYL